MRSPCQCLIRRGKGPTRHASHDRHTLVPPLKCARSLESSLAEQAPPRVKIQTAACDHAAICIARHFPRAPQGAKASSRVPEAWHDPGGASNFWPKRTGLVLLERASVHWLPRRTGKLRGHGVPMSLLRLEEEVSSFTSQTPRHALMMAPRHRFSAASAETADWHSVDTSASDTLLQLKMLEALPQREAGLWARPRLENEIVVTALRTAVEEVCQSHPEQLSAGCLCLEKASARGLKCCQSSQLQQFLPTGCHSPVAPKVSTAQH